MARVLLVCPRRSPFVVRDEALLGEQHQVTVLEWKGPGGLLGKLRRLRRAVQEADVVYNWFAAEHAAFSTWFARRAGVPVIAMIGGYDAARVPEIDYGIHQWGGWGARLARYAARHSDILGAVDPSLAVDLAANTGIDAAKVEDAPTGYDADDWTPGPKDAVDTDPPVVLTAGALTAIMIRRKGLDTFVAAAAQVPEARFVLLGAGDDEAAQALRDGAPDNVHFPGFVAEDELRSWMQRAHVYCQLSRYEGLPNALCEAMLCGAVPVGTPHCGIPTAIGDTGPIVPFADVEATAAGIRKALALPAPSTAARSRIAGRFPESRRRDWLLGAVERAVPPHAAGRR